MSATTTTKGGETLYVHVNAESDKEIDFLYKNEEELSNALKAAIQEQGTQVPNLEASVCFEQSKVGANCECITHELYDHQIILISLSSLSS